MHVRRTAIIVSIHHIVRTVVQVTVKMSQAILPNVYKVVYLTAISVMDLCVVAVIQDFL